MAKETGRAMGTGGSGGIFGRKAELVADITSAFKELNRELEKTKKLSEDISNNLKGIKPGSGSNLLGSSFGASTGTKTAAENDGSQSGGGGLGSTLLTGLKNLGIFAGKSALIGLQGLPTVQQTFEQDLLRARFGFYGGAGANATQLRMARMGTTTDPLDAARASMTGASMGLLPGLSNFRTIEQSAAGISNLMPGVGLQGGMQATAALNQARNVNMLRMIGVNVRGANGLMRGVEEITNDLWDLLSSQARGPISKKDISFSLQPGMSLDSMLNQYFGNDPILRQSIISALMNKAGGGGSFTDKQGLISEGATTSAVVSSSERNAASLNAIQAVAPSTLAGFEKANELLAAASNKVADIARDAGLMGDAFRKILEGKGFLDTVGSSGNGAGAGFMGLLGNTAGSFLGSLLGSKGKLGAGTMSQVSSKLGAIGKFMPKTFLGFLGRGALGFGAYKGLDKVQNFLNDKGDFLPDWLQAVGNLAFDTGQGAVTGLATAGIPGLIGGTGVGFTQGVYGVKNNSNRPGQGGSDTDTATPTLGNVMPFSGSFPITSPFGVVRHLTFANGQKSPSYGRPHGGIDYGTPEGTPLFAVTDGVVEPTGYDAPGFGNYVKIRTKDGEELYYGHMSQKALSGGSRVKAGDLIGYSGNSGNSTGPHLHFEVRKNGAKLDPSLFLSGAGSASLTDNAVPPSAAGGLTVSSNLTGLIFNSGGPSMTPAPEYGATGRASDAAQTVNYGGVTINFHMPEKSSMDVKAIANEVKRVLSHDNIREKAVNR